MTDWRGSRESSGGKSGLWGGDLGRGWRGLGLRLHGGGGGGGPCEGCGWGGVVEEVVVLHDWFVLGRFEG